MKVVVVLGEGLGGEPLADLNGKTVLEAAKTPQLDELAAQGILGLTRFGAPPAGQSVDAAALAVLGYDPGAHRVGRGALEAVGRGVELQRGDVAFCADLVSLRAQPDGSELMAGMAGGGIDPGAALRLGTELAAVLAGDGIELLPFAGARQLLIWHGGEALVKTTPPAAVIERPVAPHLPTGPGADLLRDLMRRACEVLAPQASTDTVVRDGRAGANALWIWGAGTRPTLPSFPLRAMGSVTAVTSTGRGCGLARIARMSVIDGSATANPLPLVLRAIDESDVCFVELDPFANNDVPARAHDRVEAMERIDAQIMQPLVQHLKAAGGPWRCLVVLSLAEAQSDQPAPFLVGVHEHQHGPRVLARRFHERDAREQGIFIPEAHTLMERLLRRE